METVNEFNELVQEFHINYLKLVKKSIIDAYDEFRYTAENKLDAGLEEQVSKSLSGELSLYELYILIEATKNFENDILLNMVDIWLLVRKDKGKKSLNFRTFIGTGRMAFEEAKNALGENTEVRTGRDKRKYVINLNTQDKIYVRPLWSVLKR